MPRIYSQRIDSPTADQLILQETLFHNANGYIGVRGALEEGTMAGADTVRGTYINGFFENVPMKQAEKLTNVSEEKETMINIADTQGMLFSFDGETFLPDCGKTQNYVRTLDMDCGVTERTLLWTSPSGKKVEIAVRRMTSFAYPQLFTIDYRVTPQNFSGEVTLTSTQLALVKNHADPNDPRMAAESECHLLPLEHFEENDAGYLSVRTKNSHLELSVGVAHRINLPSASHLFYDAQQHSYTYQYTVSLHEGKTLRVVKYCVFADSRRYSSPMSSARKTMKEVFGQIDQLYIRQQEILADFWRNANAHISGDEDANRSMEYNLYELFQSAGRDGLSSIAAKGLSGEGYEGHYFWDTEMYMMPFFTFTMPELAKKLLSYRYSTLDKARNNARLLGHAKGALFPWRTITGEECSGYFLAGTAQYHINGDISYAVVNYYLATGDRDYLEKEGAEILLETARLWLDVGHEADGAFRIHCVTGPDEYTCMVNNNYYTNACAKFNLLWAVKAAKLLREWGAYDTWAQHLQVSEEELKSFRQAAEKMLLLYDEKLGINPQDDSFLMKPVWDFAHTPKENYPLLLHYHPLELYRYQVCKQADTVLAHVLFEDWSAEDVRRRSFDYYEKITTHDSSLSHCIFCIDACRLGLKEKAQIHFGDSVKTDLMDTHGNSKDGIHTANMGGCYMAVIYGFVGLRLLEDGIRISPFLPDEWTGLELDFQYQRNHLHLAVDKNGYALTLEEGKGLNVFTSTGKHRLDCTGETLKEN